MKKNLGVEFYLNKSRTPHSQGHVKCFVRLFKMCLYRTIGPFSDTKRLEDLILLEFRNILAKIGYALNQRPFTALSQDNNDLNFENNSFLLFFFNQIPGE